MTPALLLLTCLLQAPAHSQHLKPTALHNGNLDGSANWGWYHPSTRSGGALERSGDARLSKHEDANSEFGSGEVLLLEPGASAVMNLADIRNRPLSLKPGVTYDVAWSQKSAEGSRLEVMLLDGRMTKKADIRPEKTDEITWHRRHGTFTLPEDAPEDMPYMLVFEHPGHTPDRDVAEARILIDDVSLSIVRTDSSEFESLFDGRTLEGWTGATKGYRVREGAIECSKAQFGGNLMTAETFDDFVLRFEFKLFPGSNNGIALRAPLDGDPAYLGMESQVLDNGDPRYKGIRPWQRHGSIYGISPALPGYQSPSANGTPRKSASRVERFASRSTARSFSTAISMRPPPTEPCPARSTPDLIERVDILAFVATGRRGIP